MRKSREKGGKPPNGSTSAGEPQSAVSSWFWVCLILLGLPGANGESSGEGDGELFNSPREGEGDRGRRNRSRSRTPLHSSSDKSSSLREMSYRKEWVSKDKRNRNSQEKDRRTFETNSQGRDPTTLGRNNQGTVPSTLSPKSRSGRTEGECTLKEECFKKDEKERRSERQRGELA